MDRPFQWGQKRSEAAHVGGNWRLKGVYAAYRTGSCRILLQDREPSDLYRKRRTLLVRSSEARALPYLGLSLRPPLAVLEFSFGQDSSSCHAQHDVSRR
jgi:hypothetical protein